MAAVLALPVARVAAGSRPIFDSTRFVELPGVGRAFVTADFNRDGNLDILSPDTFTNVVVYLGNQSLGFAFGSRMVVGLDPINFAPGHFNSDSHLDFAVAAERGPYLKFFFGNGDGTFVPGTNYNVGPWPCAAKAADLNGDSLDDVIVMDRSVGLLSVLLARGDGNFDFTHDQSGTGVAGTDFTLADLNHDGNKDLLVGNSMGPNGFAVLLALGSGWFGTPVLYPIGAYVQNCAVSFFNDDEHPDVVVGHRSLPGQVTVLIGDGTGELTQGGILTNSRYVEAVSAEDLNGDGNQDILVQIHNGREMLVYTGNGEGDFTTHTNFLFRTDPWYIPDATEIQDIDLDGRPDILGLRGGGIAIMPNRTQPRLGIEHRGNSVVVSGPQWLGYCLERSVGLASWSRLNCNVSGDRRKARFTNELDDVAAFYRLRRD